MSEWNPPGEWRNKWFIEYALPIWEKLLLPHLGDVRSYLEIGISEGLSMLWVLEHLLAGKEGAFADGVDPYWPARNFGSHIEEAKQRRVICAQNLALWAGMPRPEYPQIPSMFFRVEGVEGGGTRAVYPECRLHIESSESFLVAARAAQQYDLIYVDGNHNASDALLDVVLCWRLLKVGGVMVVDDLDQRYRGNRPRAWHAVRAFEDCFDSLYDTVFVHQRQKAFRKIERRRAGHPPTLRIGDPIEPRK